METLLPILLLAFLVEAIIESVSLVKNENGWQWKPIAAFILGLVGSLAFGVGLAEPLGLEITFSNPEYVDAVFSGLLFMRGSGKVNDLLKRYG